MSGTGPDEARLMRLAVELATEGIARGDGGPFGAVVAVGEEVVGRGWNRVLGTCDPTAHAEMSAIRDACARLRRVHLPEAVLYTTCEPCPMCLSASYWARLGGVVYANTRDDAELIGFADARQYRELTAPPSARSLPVRRCEAGTALDAARALFRHWQQESGGVVY